MHVGIKNNHAKMNTTNTNKKIKLTEQKQISGREKKNKGNKTERVSDGKKSDRLPQKGISDRASPNQQREKV